MVTIIIIITIQVTSLDMASGLTEEQREIQSLASSFAMNELFPMMAAWDQGGVFPVETLKAAATLGFGAIYTSAEYGGTGLSRFGARDLRVLDTSDLNLDA